MKKIKLPLEMANGVMVTKSLEELKENWDLEKIVGYFGDGRLVTWLNDRYYTDLADQVQKITAKGAEAQKELCAIFGIEFKQDEVVDAEALAERKRKLDVLRQYTSDDEILKNVDSVAFNQEDLADLLDEGVEKIYLCNGKFSVPLNISGKKYIGVADAEVYIGKEELQDFDKLGISFENVKFDEKYQKLVEEKSKKADNDKKEMEERTRIQSSKKVGDIIKFGKWDLGRGDFLEEKIEDIEWKILSIQDGKALLLSEYGMDDKHRVKKITDGYTWEECSLRNWLNKDFFRNAFGRTEKEGIVLTKVKAEKNPDYDTEQGNDTEDRIFLLSIQEAEKYFENNEERKCYEFRRSKVISFIRDNDKTEKTVCAWRLRSLGDFGGEAAYVSEEGSIDYEGDEDAECAIRPAMWVDLSKMEDKL